MLHRSEAAASSPWTTVASGPPGQAQDEILDRSAR
jgi:hypothetical protein